MSQTDDIKNSIVSIGGLVNAARQAHPAFKWAITVSGIAALLGIITKFGLSPAALVFGVILFIALMFLFVVFARAATLSKTALSTPALVLVWAFAIFAIITVGLLLSSTFFNTPIPLRDQILKIQPYSTVSLRVYPKPLEALGEVPTLLGHAKKGTTITFLGIHFATTTDDLDDELVAALHRGVTIRYLVLTSASNVVSSYCTRYGQSESKIGSEIATSFANIERLDRAFRNSALSPSQLGSLEIRVLQFVPAQRIYWFDYGATGSEAIVTQYAMGVRSSDSPALRFDSDSPLGKHYETSMRWHWDQGIPFEKWKKANQTSG